MVQNIMNSNASNKPYEAGEVIGIVKYVVCQMLILESPNFARGVQKDEKGEPVYDHANLINQYTNELKKIGDEYQQYLDRYLNPEVDI